MSANNTPMSVTAKQFMQFDFCALYYFRRLQEIQRRPALRLSLAIESLRDVAVPDQRNHRAQRGGRQNMLSFEEQRAMAQVRQKKTVVGFSDPSIHGALTAAPCVRLSYVWAQREGLAPAGSVDRFANLLLPRHPFSGGRLGSFEPRRAA
jgi:hypothetical protein